MVRNIRWRRSGHSFSSRSLLLADRPQGGTERRLRRRRPAAATPSCPQKTEVIFRSVEFLPARGLHPRNSRMRRQSQAAEWGWRAAPRRGHRRPEGPESPSSSNSNLRFGDPSYRGDFPLGTQGKQAEPAPVFQSRTRSPPRPPRKALDTLALGSKCAPGKLIVEGEGTSRSNRGNGIPCLGGSIENTKALPGRWAWPADVSAAPAGR